MKNVLFIATSILSLSAASQGKFYGGNGDGFATNKDWPGYTAGQGVNTAIGCGYRGGVFDFPNPTQLNLRVSSRILSTAFYNTRYFDDVAKFVRSE